MTAVYAQALANAVPHIGAWQYLNFFQSSGQFQNVRQYLQHDPRTIYPDASLVFDVLRCVQPCNVKVVILGQDPYPTPGMATGHAFAMPNGFQPRRGSGRSLQNISQVVNSNTGSSINRQNQDLNHWVRQGVLLLNTALTVPEDQAGCHCRVGWEHLINEVIQHLRARNNIYWMFWGRKAQRLRPPNLYPQQYMTASHPVARGNSNSFLQSSPFVDANNFLRSLQLPIISW